MSNKNAIAEFADTLLLRFPPFRQWEEYQEKAWAADMVAELSGFSAAVIQQAQRQIIRSRKPRDPRPPMVSECIEACLEARRLVEANRQAETLPEMRSGGPLDWTTERLKLARDLMHTDLGRQAAKEGWIGALFSYARRNAKLPADKAAVEAVKREAKEFDAAYAQSVKGGWPQAQLLENHRQQLIERRQRLEREVLGR
jgi:hypothetical protein